MTPAPKYLQRPGKSPSWGPGREPATDQRTLGVSDLCRIVLRHSLEHHGLLVNTLRVLSDLFGGIEAHVLVLHLRAVTHGAALRDYALHFCKRGRRGRR